VPAWPGNFGAGWWPGWVPLPPGFLAAVGESICCPVCRDDAAGERNEDQNGGFA
jgi:hypothetical protein